MEHLDMHLSGPTLSQRPFSTKSFARSSSRAFFEWKFWVSLRRWRTVTYAQQGSTWYVFVTLAACHCITVHTSLSQTHIVRLRIKEGVCHNTREPVQILSLLSAEANLNFYCFARRSHPRLFSRLALMFTCIAMHVYCLCLGLIEVPHLQRQACSNTMQLHPVPDQFLQLHASATTAPWVSQDDRALAFRDVSPQVGEWNCLGVENLMQ